MFAVQTNSSRSGAGEGARVWVTRHRLVGRMPPQEPNPKELGRVHPQSPPRLAGHVLRRDDQESDMPHLLRLHGLGASVDLQCTGDRADLLESHLRDAWSRCLADGRHSDRSTDLARSEGPPIEARLDASGRPGAPAHGDDPAGHPRAHHRPGRSARHAPRRRGQPPDNGGDPRVRRARRHRQDDAQPPAGPAVRVRHR